jgi:nucleotide-binding universal stress UspA family protein
MANTQTILVLTDFSKIADRAADLALELALNNQKDLLIYNSVISIEASVLTEERRSSIDEITLKTGKSQANLKQLTDRLTLKLSAEQQSKLKITVEEGTGGPMETILNLVAENNIWMVVMGNHDDKQITNKYFDSNVPFVMNNCGCPLLLVP